MTVSLTAMRVTQPNFSIPVAQTRPPSDAMSERRLSSAGLQQRHAQEHINAKVSIPSAAMSFAIDLGGNSITVTLADRISGEVLRQLVYEFGGLPRSASKTNGRLIDISA